MLSHVLSLCGHDRLPCRQMGDYVPDLDGRQGRLKAQKKKAPNAAARSLPQPAAQGDVEARPHAALRVISATDGRWRRSSAHAAARPVSTVRMLYVAGQMSQTPWGTLAERFAHGRRLRKKVPRERHAELL